MLSKEQQTQEEEYEFPYHHLLNRKNLRGIEYFAYIDLVLFLARKYSKTSNPSILDLGCGDGKTTKEIKKKFENATGVDYSERAVAFAKAFSPKIKFIVEDITKERKKLAKYDVVVSIEVIEHIPPKELPHFIKSISSLVKKRGIVILTTPTINMKRPSKHYQHFTRKKIEKLCEPYFKTKGVFYQQNKNVSWLFRIIRGVFTNRIYDVNIGIINRFIKWFYHHFARRATRRTGQRIIYVCEKI